MTDLCFINKAQSFDKHEGRSKAAVAEWEFAPTKLWKILSKKSSMCKLWCSVSNGTSEATDEDFESDAENKKSGGS